MKRSRPKQHVRKVRSGKRVLINSGVSKKKKATKKRAMAVSADISVKDKKAIMNQSYLEIVSQLKKEGRVRVPEIGVFTIKKKRATKARKGINPFTKEPTMFKAKPARRLVKFNPSKTFKEAI